MNLSDIVVRGAIVPELASSERDGVIAELLDALLAAGVADRASRDALLKAILDREQKSSTGFGKGVAVPHVRHASVTKLSAAVGLSPRGIDFSALDRQPVYSVFLLLSPADKPDDHLQAMEVIFKSLSNDVFRRFLRQATSVEDVVSLLDDADGQNLPA
ncbi:MAG: PTS sugar transporter subunit IIA [Phycisphaerales bacterium]|jgi:mannitol/fructose-specific phosphotransferase system IIA component (Ntr-type)|nr:PTS sugar transporter subunit IIA [Phycisphaerales bacterium]